MVTSAGGEVKRPTSSKETEDWKFVGIKEQDDLPLMKKDTPSKFMALYTQGRGNYLILEGIFDWTNSMMIRASLFEKNVEKGGHDFFRSYNRGPWPPYESWRDLLEQHISSCHSKMDPYVHYDYMETFLHEVLEVMGEQ